MAYFARFYLYLHKVTVVVIRRLYAGFSLSRLGFVSTFYVRVMIVKMAVGKFSFQVLRSSPVSIVSPILHTHLQPPMLCDVHI
jgi:hypothetical protein